MISGVTELRVAAEIDCRGLLCPLPILRTRKALEGLSSGELLRMIATDPGSVPDMAAFSRMTGHTVEQRDEQDGEFIFLVRKA